MKAIIRRLLRPIVNLRFVSLGWCRLRGQIGKGVSISRNAQILGWRNIRIGNGTVLSDHVCININSRDRREYLEIGKHVFVANGCFFSTGDRIQIGDYCLIGRLCQFLNAGHIMDPLRPYVATGIDPYPLMRIGANAWLTNSIIVVGGVSIGYGSIIGAGSLVTSNIPPLSLALGTPAKVVKFFDPRTRAWTKINAEQDYESQLQAHLLRIPSETEYLSMISGSGEGTVLPHKAMGATKGDFF